MMSDSKAKKTPSDELSKHLSENTNEEHLKLARAYALGGAAASLAILVQLLQLGVESFFLKITVLAISFSLPLWIAISAIYEVWIVAGAPGIQQYRAKFVNRILGFLTVLAATSLLVGVAAIIFFLLPFAFWLFLVTSAFCFLLVLILMVLLARNIAYSRKVT
jgi:hypothetical protein